jgi:hypothetical protein
MWILMRASTTPGGRVADAPNLSRIRRCGHSDGGQEVVARRAAISASVRGTSKVLVRLEAPATRTTSRGGRPSASARRRATAAFAAPSAGGAVTRTRRTPPGVKPSSPLRAARGVTRTVMRVMVGMVPRPEGTGVRFRKLEHLFVLCGASSMPLRLSPMLEWHTARRLVNDG